MKLVTLGCAITLGVGMTTHPYTTHAVAIAGWRLVRHVDPTAESQRPTLVRRSNDGTSSLHVNCNYRANYVVFLTFAKSAPLGDPPTAEIRFDQDASRRYVLTRVQHSLLADMIGASATDATYAVAAIDRMTGSARHSDLSGLVAAGVTLVQQFNIRSQMVYRHWLPHGVIDTDITFNLTGFRDALKPLSAHCPSEPVRGEAQAAGGASLDPLMMAPRIRANSRQ